MNEKMSYYNIKLTDKLSGFDYYIKYSCYRCNSTLSSHIRFIRGYFLDHYYDEFWNPILNPKLKYSLLLVNNDKLNDFDNKYTIPRINYKDKLSNRRNCK